MNKNVSVAETEYRINYAIDSIESVSQILEILHTDNEMYADEDNAPDYRKIFMVCINLLSDGLMELKGITEDETS